MTQIPPARQVPALDPQPPVQRVGQRWIDFLFALTVATLFTRAQVDIHIPGATGHAPLTAPLMVLTAVLTLVGFAKRSGLMVSICLPLLAFVAVHVLSALRLGAGNCVRELAEASMTFSFAWAFGARYSRVSIRNFFMLFAPMAACIMIYNIGWHVGQGYYYMWKRLYNPKALFDLMPLLIAGYLLTRQRFPIGLAVLLMVAAGGIILLSGERKAYISFMIAILLMLNPRNAASYVAPVVLVALVYVGIKLSGSTYVMRQVQTLLGTVGIGPMPDSVSASERAWQIHLGMLFLRENPLFGVGTNGFMWISQSLYSSSGMSEIGIHGEGLRVLVEDGFFGLAVYGVFLVTSLLQIASPRNRAGSTSGEIRVALLWYLTLLVYTSFEGSNLLLMAMQYSMGFIGRINFTAYDRPPLEQWRRTITEAARRGEAIPSGLALA